MCDRCGCEGDAAEQAAHHAVVAQARHSLPTVEIAVHERLLADNDHAAAHNRSHFRAHRICAVNLMGTPGAGKTALLEATIRASAGRWRLGVVEGDQATARDSARIAAAGAPVTQIETGLGCHLSAPQVHDALGRVPLAGLEVLFIENVGNLVCPALFDLGEHLRVVVTSPAEGTDKPLKYPPMFRAADVVVLNKLDLLPYVPFALDEWRQFVGEVNPRARVVTLSALTGTGMDAWLALLEGARAAVAGDG